MTRYTFAIQWPIPFDAEWQTSGRSFNTTNEAGQALGEYLAISADNGVLLAGKLVIVPNA